MTMTPPGGAPGAAPPAPAAPPRPPAPPAPLRRSDPSATERPGAGRLRTFVRGRWLRTIPGRVGIHAVLCLAAIVALLAMLTVAIGNARDSVQTIGHDAGPQVVATGTLYFALSDMDAQVSNILLIGRDHDLGIGHDESLRLYERRRAEADAAAVEAAQLAGSDPALRRTVQEVLDGLGRYERLVGRAMELDAQADHAPGELPQEVIDAYRQATDLMRLQLLPKAYNITLDTGAHVRQDYETNRSAVLTGRTWVAVTGIVVLLLLIATQLYLARTFRRVLNPALVLATLAALALTAVGTGLLTAQAGHIRKAKEDGFDSILQLSRARAISHSAFADESRYLLDPGRADTYEQTYLDKSLSVIQPDMGDKPVNLANYYAGLEEKLGAYRAGGDDVPFLGFFGDEARTVEPGREADALQRTLQAYRVVQRNDARMRELASSGDRAGAVDLRMGRTSDAISDFGAYDAALTALTAVHQDAFDDAIRDADGGLRGWNAVPAAGAAAIALLILAGIRPRLAEFR
ncbi:hypothetical protein [Actinomadura livida]|uniref:Secreted protein n=1 Tax=Actinomadura livida TaxID=79909 RepID=A0A7W7MVN2_9ACTN|nr:MULTISPECIES: hypothetical protein [Actinomadura]MBB4771967.1 hypothetical protein [Actinomadura catellatispora]GGU03746.1 hypothetical protein GCM10010208_29910 [Actinomadura livida]